MIYFLVPFILIYLVYNRIQIRRNWQSIIKAKRTLSMRFSSIFIFSSLIPNAIIGSAAILFIEYQVGSVFNPEIRSMMSDISSISQDYISRLESYIKTHMTYCFTRIIEEWQNNKHNMQSLLIQHNAEYQFRSSFIAKYSASGMHYLYEASTTSEKIDIDIPVWINNMDIGKIEFIQQSKLMIGIGKINKDIYAIITIDLNKEFADIVSSRVNQYYSIYTQTNTIFYIILYILYGLVLLTCIFSVIGGTIISNRLIAPFDSLIFFERKDQRWKRAYPELMIFIKKFRAMLTDLNIQNDQLAQSNIQLKERNIIIENILTAAPMGIAVFNAAHEIIMSNQISKELLTDEILSQIKELIKSSEEFLSIQSGNREIRIRYKENILLIEDITEFMKYKKTILLEKVARQVAHEIKNPLTPIQLAIHVLKQDSNKKECIYIIEKNINQIKLLVDAFTQFSSLPQCQFEQVSIKFIIESIANYNTIFDKCTIITPQEIPNIYIYADKDMLERTLLNIVKNSVEAYATEVTISCEMKDKYILIGFHDNGIGFQNLENPSKLYYTTKEHGTGIGLAIVEKTLIQHNGEVDYLNSMIYNHGASVVIKLPCKEKF